jgi:hypothetical protein
MARFFTVRVAWKTRADGYPGRHDGRDSGKLDLSPEAGVAQLVEQLIRNQQVIGSSPIAGSKYSLQTTVDS